MTGAHDLAAGDATPDNRRLSDLDPRRFADSPQPGVEAASGRISDEQQARPLLPPQARLGASGVGGAGGAELHRTRLPTGRGLAEGGDVARWLGGTRRRCDHGDGCGGHGHNGRLPGDAMAQPSVSDRLFDQVVGDRRGCERHPEAQRVERRSGETCTSGGEPHVHRPVPEVQPVRQPAEPDEHGKREHRLQWPWLHGAGHDDGHGHGVEERAALVVGAGGGGHVVPGPDDAGQADEAQRAQCVTDEPVPRRTDDEDDGEQCADQEGVAAAVGPVVGAGWILRPVQHGHGHGRYGGATDGHAGQEPERASQAQAREDCERPYQIELFLDREGPQVAQRRRSGEQVEVGLAREDEAPVGHVEKGRQPVSSNLRPLDGRHHRCGEEGDENEDDQEGGKQAPCPTCPELPEGDRATRAELEQEQGRDQEAREDEEGVDAEEPATAPPIPRVVGDDGQH